MGAVTYVDLPNTCLFKPMMPWQPYRYTTDRLTCGVSPFGHVVEKHVPVHPIPSSCWKCVLWMWQAYVIVLFIKKVIHHGQRIFRGG